MMKEKPGAEMSSCLFFFIRLSKRRNLFDRLYALRQYTCSILDNINMMDPLDPHLFRGHITSILILN